MSTASASVPVVVRLPAWRSRVALIALLAAFAVLVGRSVYLQSMKRNFAGFAQPLRALEWDGSAASLDAAARQVASL